MKKQCQSIWYAESISIVINFQESRWTQMLMSINNIEKAWQLRR